MPLQFSGECIVPPSKTFLDNGGVSVESTREQAATFQSGPIA